MLAASAQTNPPSHPSTRWSTSPANPNSPLKTLPMLWSNVFMQFHLCASASCSGIWDMETLSVHSQFQESKPSAHLVWRVPALDADNKPPRPARRQYKKHRHPEIPAPVS